MVPVGSRRDFPWRWPVVPRRISGNRDFRAPEIENPNPPFAGSS